MAVDNITKNKTIYEYKMNYEKHSYNNEIYLHNFSTHIHKINDKNKKKKKIQGELLHKHLFTINECE